jgi:hypothetical protein
MLPLHEWNKVLTGKRRQKQEPSADVHQTESSCPPQKATDLDEEVRS